MRRVGIGDALIPAHPRDPGGGLIEGALRRGQCCIVALNVELETDGAGERFGHAVLFYRRQVETERDSGASSPRLKPGVSAPLSDESTRLVAPLSPNHGGLRG